MIVIMVLTYIGPIRETYRSTRNFSPVLLKFRNEISSTCHVFVDPLSTFTLFTLRAVHSWIVLWQCTVRLFNWVPTYSCTQPKFDLNADIYCVVLKKLCVYNLKNIGFCVPELWRKRKGTLTLVKPFDILWNSIGLNFLFTSSRQFIGTRGRIGRSGRRPRWRHRSLWPQHVQVNSPSLQSATEKKRRPWNKRY